MAVNQTQCNGLCVTAADAGVGSSSVVAYPHPDCWEHGDPHLFHWSGKFHETHEGLLRLCDCGVYEDEHPLKSEEAQGD